MGAIANGIALYGMYIPFTATFLTFSDYMRPAIRLGGAHRHAGDSRLHPRLGVPRRGRADPSVGRARLGAAPDSATWTCGAPATPSSAPRPGPRALERTTVRRRSSCRGRKWPSRRRPRGWKMRCAAATCPARRGRCARGRCSSRPAAKWASRWKRRASCSSRTGNARARGVAAVPGGLRSGRTRPGATTVLPSSGRRVSSRPAVPTVARLGRARRDHHRHRSLRRLGARRRARRKIRPHRPANRRARAEWLAARTNSLPTPPMT